MMRPNQSMSFEDFQQEDEFAKSQLETLNHDMTMSVLPVTIFIGIECAVGLIGNSLILLVYTFYYEKSNFRYFVISMGMVDLTSCLTTIPAEIFAQMNWYTYEHAWICKVNKYFNVMTAWASSSVLFGLAFDRYRKLCRPFAWQLQRSTVLKLCITFVTIAAVVASPITVIYGKQDYVYVDGNLTVNVSVCQYGRYSNGFNPLMYIAGVYIIPIGAMLCVLSVLNVLTARALFCGMRDLHRRLCSESSVSTVCSVVSNTSFDDLSHEKNNQPTCEMAAPGATANNQLNSRCTNIDVKKDIRGQSCPENTKEMKPTQSPSNPTDISAIAVCNSDNDNVTFTTDFTNIEEPEGSSVTFDTNSSSDYSSRETSSGSGSTGRLRRLSSRTSNSPKKERVKTRERKTKIMLALTTVYVVTMLMYIIMTSFVAGAEGTLKDLSNSGKVWFFFFWRMYFINCLANPFLYGFLDPRFRSGLKAVFRKK